MVFTPDVCAALGAAAEITNTEDPETLASLDELRAFYRSWGYTGSRPRTSNDLAAVRAIRPRLRLLLTADRDTAVGMVNEILAEQRALPQLVRHDDLDWHIHAVSEDRPMHERILVETAMAMVDLIRADELDRLGVCAARDCRGIVVDLSRNRSRRFCSTTCGNREAQAAYRSRQAR
ncbi:MAG TPA: CGNR zinc finger domain-containing protein [Actinomycetota bacterium]|nr:CGNR zinc finger domain-containing protein [Actinomycetota bacterium]